MLKLKKSLYQILLIFLFLLMFQTVFSIREIPHTIIKENPMKEVTEISTLKKREKDAELNLEITKIKSRNIDLKIDFERRKMFAILEDLGEGDRVFIVEKLEDIPNLKTSIGRKALNKVKNMKTSTNFSFKVFDLKTKNNYKKVEIDFRQIPKETFIGITGSDYKLKSIYKGRYVSYSVPKNNNVDIKLWLFGEDLDRVTNLIITSSKNSTGNIMLRSEGKYSYPEGAIERLNLYSVFDMNGSPLSFDFEDSDTLEIENTSGISGVINNQGSFYKNRNKFVQFSIPGYRVKSRIWSDYSGVELSLEKSGVDDGYVKFSLVQRNSSGELIQKINFEIFINNKSLDNYFQFNSFSSAPAGGIIENNYNPIPVDVRVKNFFTEELNLITLDNYSIEKRSGKTGEISIINSSIPQKILEKKDFNTTSMKVSGNITKVSLYIDKKWITSDETQFFTSDGIEMRYGNNKRKVTVKSRIGINANEKFSTEKIVGEIIGLPILNKELTSLNTNTKPTVEYFSTGSPFKVVYSSSKLGLFVDDVQVDTVNGNLDESKISLKSSIGLEMGVKFSYTENDGKKHYALHLKKLELTDRVRETKITSKDYYHGVSPIKENNIKISKFTPLMLINRDNSSLKKNILKIENISTEFYNHDKIIELGSVFFYQMDLGIIKQNTNKNPKVELAKKVYLETEQNVKTKIIEAELTFKKDKQISALEMKIDGDKGKGENGQVYLKIQKEEYRKFVLNGGNVTYKLKIKDSSATHIAKVLFEKNKSSFGIIGDKIFEDTLIESVEIRTNEIFPNITKIKFVENTPLLKEKYFVLDRNRISYTNAPNDGYNYNNTFRLEGEVVAYNHQGKHNVEIIDNSGNKIQGIIGNNVNGAMWSNLDIGDGNTVNILYRKNDTKTYMNLTNWNYEEATGKVIIKHFVGGTEHISQYYQFNFQLPKFNPYIYYNRTYNSDSIELGDSITKNIQVGVNEVVLGTIATNNYNVEITRQENGELKDNEGLRIEANKNVMIIEEKSGIRYPKEGKLILVDQHGNEITANKIIGGKKYAKVILKIPEDLPRDKNYKIVSSIDIDKLFSDEEGYLLKIGRNKYFKEIIKEIKLKGDLLLKGESSLEITADYQNGEKINFKTTTYDNLEGLQLKKPIPNGVFLKETQGYGILKAQKGDQIYLKQNDGVLKNIGQIDSMGDLKNIPIELSKNNKIEIFFKSGAFGIVMNERTLGGKILDNLDLFIERNGKNIVEHRLKIILPESWFIITEKKEIDFGNVPAGTKNNIENGEIRIKTSKELNYSNIGYELKKNLIELKPSPTSRAKPLEVNIINSSLNKTNLSDEYLLNIDAKIDVPIESDLGEQKGVLEVTIFVKE